MTTLSLFITCTWPKATRILNNTGKKVDPPLPNNVYCVTIHLPRVLCLEMPCLLTSSLWLKASFAMITWTSVCSRAFPPTQQAVQRHWFSDFKPIFDMSRCATFFKNQICIASHFIALIESQLNAIVASDADDIGQEPSPEVQSEATPSMKETNLNGSSVLQSTTVGQVNGPESSPDDAVSGQGLAHKRKQENYILTGEYHMVLNT